MTLDLSLHHSASLAGPSRVHVTLGSEAPLSASGPITGGARSRAATWTETSAPWK
jgi:hypothetical protein